VFVVEKRKLRASLDLVLFPNFNAEEQYEGEEDRDWIGRDGYGLG
jgi:hypothetical protein